LAKKYRWHFERGLFELYGKDKLRTPFSNLIDFKKFMKEVNKQDWIVSIQAPLKKADDIVHYVGRYTKRACISEHNILSADNGEIRFKYKDYKRADHSGKPTYSELTLSYTDFFGRLFQHVPSKGFRVVRYYGIYSNRKLNRPWIIKKKNDDLKLDSSNWRSYQIRKTGLDPLICPCCNKEMILVQEYYDNRTRWVRMKTADNILNYWQRAV
jgi:hypothetical protein